MYFLSLKVLRPDFSKGAICLTNNNKSIGEILSNLTIQIIIFIIV